MFRPNYIQQTPIMIADPASPYSDGLILTQANHQVNIAANEHKNYYRLSQSVYDQSITTNDWLRMDTLAGNHAVLLGVMLSSPELEAGGTFDTAILRTVSFNGLVSASNVGDLNNGLQTFVWTGMSRTDAPDNAGIKVTRNYNILSAGGQCHSVDKSFILATDNFAIAPEIVSIPHAVVVGFGIYNADDTAATTVQCRFTMTASQHLHERPTFDPSR